MAFRFILSREQLVSANVCQEGLDFFDSYTQGAGAIDQDWDETSELNMQQLAPQFLLWLRQHGCLPTPNFSGMNLSGIDLKNSDFRSADLSGADLSNSDLSGANLRYANLIGANLTGANLDGTKLGHAARIEDPPDGWYLDVDGFLRRIV